MLFTDGSVNTKIKVGYGAYLALSEGQDLQNSQTDRIKVKRFIDTSSTHLELQTLLWALSEISAPEIISYTDSQNIVGLHSRRIKLEENDYYAKSGKRLSNCELYKQFYKITDNLNIKFVQIRGHLPSDQKSNIEKIFSLVDRASRNAMRTDSNNYNQGTPAKFKQWINRAGGWRSTLSRCKLTASGGDISSAAVSDKYSVMSFYKYFLKSQQPFLTGAFKWKCWRFIIGQQIDFAGDSLEFPS